MIILLIKQSALYLYNMQQFKYLLKFSYNKDKIIFSLVSGNLQKLKFYSNHINIKKLIKWSSNIFIKTIKFKTHNKYFKGYQKN